MNKKQDLLNAISNYPDRRLVVMFSSEGNSDYAYTVGEIKKVEITETTEYNDRIYFSDEYNDLLEELETIISIEKYGDTKLTSNETAEIEQLSKKEMKNFEWEPVIVIYVGS